MSDNDEKKFVDELLDAGLARYSADEPRPGLENRILAGLRAQPQPSPWLDWRLPRHWRGWAGALATAAVAVVVLAVFFLRQQPLPEPPPPAVAKVTVPQPMPTATASETPPQPSPVATATVRHTSPSVEQARAEAPRLDTFPAPAPLSEQERLLLRFLRHAPKEQLIARQLGAGPIESLEIPPLALAPLGLPKPATEN